MNPYVIVPLFIICFALLWTGVIGLIAVLGGWRSLAAAYPLPARTLGEGRRFGMQSMRLGFLGNYNSVLAITVYRDGVVLVPIMLFKAFHPPVFIPFTAMAGAKRGKFILHWVSFRAGKKNIRITGSSASGIAEALGV